MPDPVSWFLIEQGWRVLDREGDELGKVGEALGDPQNDIFDGLTVATRLLGKPRYIPSERVTTIYEGEVRTDLAPGEIRLHEEYEGSPRV